MKQSVIIGLTILILTMPLSGCTQNNDTTSNSKDEIEVPTWNIGDYWLYTFSTPDYNDDTARLVVASDTEEDNTAYMLTISSLTEARRHAVLNHNPFLGRMTHDHLSAFENGVAQPVLNFPLEVEKSWDFSLFTIEWSAIVISLDSNLAVIHASSNDGSKLVYTFDSNIKFFSTFIWTDSNNVENLKMMHVDSGTEHSGDVYFVRGGDLFNDIWESNGPDAEVQDSFLVSDHPNDGAWDEMIYFLDANCGGGSSSISMTLRDHLSISVLERVWGPGSTESGTLGTIPYPSEEYTLTLTFSGESYFRFIVAGGITQSWSI
ncbi:MAG: hypothetical protein HOJ64_03885 [Euryarchaeota archaeon]|jgi:hypothetical protein|nr:hypothetical protein [Euryarchaeota archaeon]MBT4392056.1 hypothetical protein [Euryarchaeota archaeon]MBT4803231.1 hypothetical protein [Euryarchaeota archaeon]MBT5613993.1 hypothetical protein [Euryarchaeota archaeon]MBT6684122.1 hypothetical protein [Euryarchaeota archaeon]